MPPKAKVSPARALPNNPAFTSASPSRTQIRILCSQERSNELYDLGPGPIKIVGGFGGWEEVEIPGQEAVTDFNSGENLKLAINLMLDGHDKNDSQDGKYERLLRLGRDFDEGRESPVIQIFGAAMPPATSGRHYIITNLSSDDDDNVILSSGAKRTRQPVLVEVSEFTGGRRLRFLPKKKKKPATGGTQVPPSHYTVKEDDTLFSIALKFYGDRNQWKEIADINNIRDPRKLKVGTKIKLP